MIKLEVFTSDLNFAMIFLIVVRSFIFKLTLTDDLYE